MTTIAGDPPMMPLLPKPTSRAPIHPALRTALQEMGRLCAMIAGYGALIALFLFAALALWSNLPSAVADSKIVPGVGAAEGPIKLRGSL